MNRAPHCYGTGSFSWCKCVFLGLFVASFLLFPVIDARAADVSVVGGGGNGGAGATADGTNGAGGTGGGGGSGYSSGGGAGGNGSGGGTFGGNGAPGLGDGPSSAHDALSNAGATGLNTTGHGPAGASGGGKSTGTSYASEADNIHVVGGSGGGAGGHSGSNSGSNGGAGGNATLTLRQNEVTVGQGGAVRVISGDVGFANIAAGGLGGGATLEGTHTTLYTPQLDVQRSGNTISGSDGDVRVNLDALSVSKYNTNVNLTGLDTRDNVYFDELRFAKGKGLYVRSNNAANIKFASLDVDGLGNSYRHSLSSATPIDLEHKNMHFFIRSATVDGAVMLTVNDEKNTGGYDASVFHSNVTLSYCGSSTFYVGDTVTLIGAAHANGLNAASGISEVYQNGTHIYSTRGDTYYISQDSNGLYATLTELTPALISYAEGRAAVHAFMNQGSELIQGQGMEAALRATRDFSGLNAFAVASGGKSRYNTGSHVDVDGFNIMTGLAWGGIFDSSRLTLGLFFEAGWGGYESYNSFSRIPDVHGDGGTNYYGAGLLARWDVTQGSLAGLYAEVSGRIGSMEMEYETNDIIHTPADFDSSSLYYGAHLGLGYQFQLSEKAMLDLSAKVMWTHQDSDTVTAHHERVKFDEVDSLRTRLGGRLNYSFSEYFTPYFGAYWEHEFDGDAAIKVNGTPMSGPSLEGSTAVGELGFNFKPALDSGLSIDLSAQGYLGTREGVSGSLSLRYEF